MRCDPGLSEQIYGLFPAVVAVVGSNPEDLSRFSCSNSTFELDDLSSLLVVHGPSRVVVIGPKFRIDYLPLTQLHWFQVGNSMIPQNFTDVLQIVATSCGSHTCWLTT